MKPVGLSAVGEQANLLTREEPFTPSVWRKRGFVPTPDNDEKNKDFRDRDLYVYCFSLPDGNFTAYQSPVMIGIVMPCAQAASRFRYGEVQNQSVWSAARA